MPDREQPAAPDTEPLPPVTDWRCQDCGFRSCICGNPNDLQNRFYDYR